MRQLQALHSMHWCSSGVFSGESNQFDPEPQDIPQAFNLGREDRFCRRGRAGQHNGKDARQQIAEPPCGAGGDAVATGEPPCGCMQQARHLLRA